MTERKKPMHAFICQVLFHISVLSSFYFLLVGFSESSPLRDAVCECKLFKK